MSTCPACGVAVVPGYVRCPKCRAALPQVRFRGSASGGSGGTAVTESSRFPVVPVLAAVIIGGGIIAYFGMRGGGHPKEAQAAQPEVATSANQPAAVAAPVEGTPAEEAAPAPGRSPQGAATLLERNLKRQRLWSTVEVKGSRVDVRSGSCSDPAMATTLDGAASDLKSAGLTRLRCLEQSGRVVVERDL